MHAVVVVILRAVIPDVGGLRIGLLVIAIGAEETKGVFAVEGVDRDSQVFGVAAENGEFFDVGTVEERVSAAHLTQRDLLGEPRGLARREVVTHAAFLALIEGGFGFEIYAATEGIDAAVGGLALGELEGFEHVAREGGHARVAVLRTKRGHAAAVDADRGHAGAHAADADNFYDFVSGITKGHTRQADGELGGVHIRQVGERIHGRDVLEVIGVALLGHRGGKPLFDASDLEGIQHQHRARQDEVAHGGLAGRNDDWDRLGVEARVGDHEIVGASGRVQKVATGVVHEGAEVERGDFNFSADQTVAGGFIGHGADDDTSSRGRGFVISSVQARGEMRLNQ